MNVNSRLGSFFFLFLFGNSEPIIRYLGDQFVIPPNSQEKQLFKHACLIYTHAASPSKLDPRAELSI